MGEGGAGGGGAAAAGGSAGGVRRRRRKRRRNRRRTWSTRAISASTSPRVRERVARKVESIPTPSIPNALFTTSFAERKTKKLSNFNQQAH